MTKRNHQTKNAQTTKKIDKKIKKTINLAPRANQSTETLIRKTTRKPSPVVIKRKQSKRSPRKKSKRKRLKRKRQRKKTKRKKRLRNGKRKAPKVERKTLTSLIYVRCWS